MYNLRRSELYVYGVYDVFMKTYQDDTDGEGIPWELLGMQ
jgi:hypothetical protein